MFVCMYDYVCMYVCVYVCMYVIVCMLLYVIVCYCMLLYVIVCYCMLLYVIVCMLLYVAIIYTGSSRQACLKIFIYILQKSAEQPSRLFISLARQRRNYRES